MNNVCLRILRKGIVHGASAPPLMWLSLGVRVWVLYGCSLTTWAAFMTTFL